MKSVEFELQRQLDTAAAQCARLSERIAFLEQCLIDNVRPLEFVAMAEIDDATLDLIRRYVSAIEQMEGTRTTERAAADLDAERAELHNEIIARLQARRIVWDKRGDVTDWAFKVVRWHGK